MADKADKNRQRNRARRLRAARKRAEEAVAEARMERDRALSELERVREDCKLPVDAPRFDPAPADRLEGMTTEQVRLLRGIEDQRATVLAMLYREREARKKAEMDAVRSRSAEEAATAALKASGDSTGTISGGGMAAIDALKEEAARARSAADAAARDAATARREGAEQVQQISNLLAKAREDAEKSRAEMERERIHTAQQLEKAREEVERAESERKSALSDLEGARAEVQAAAEKIAALESQAKQLSAAAASSIDPDRAVDLKEQVIKTRDDALAAKSRLASARAETEELRRQLSQAATSLDAERRARSNAERRLQSALPIPSGVSFGKTMTVFRGTGLVEIQIDRIEFTASGAVEVADSSGVRGSAGRWRA